MDVFISVLLRLCWASESPGELDELTVGPHPRVSDSAGLLQGPRICISNELPFHAVKSVLNTHWKHWCWSWNSNTLATDVKNWLTGKHPDAGKGSRQEKGMTEDEMAGWHHQLDGHEFEQAPGVGDGQGSLACSNSWGCKESDTTEWLNWLNELPGEVAAAGPGHTFLRTISLPNMKGVILKQKNHLKCLLKIWFLTLPQRFQFSRSGIVPRNLNLNKLFRWFCCRWLADQILRKQIT